MYHVLKSVCHTVNAYKMPANVIGPSKRSVADGRYPGLEPHNPIQDILIHPPKALFRIVRGNLPSFSLVPSTLYLMNGSYSFIGWGNGFLESRLLSDQGEK